MDSGSQTLKVKISFRPRLGLQHLTLFNIQACCLGYSAVYSWPLAVVDNECLTSTHLQQIY